MKHVILSLALSLTLAAPALLSEPDSQANTPDGDVNYCLDGQANAEWAAMAAKHRDSDTWQRLFALRVGLCAMVKRGDLSVDRASKIFERERDRGIGQLQSQQPPKPFGGT